MKKLLFFLAAAAMLSLNAEVLWQADFTEDMGGFSVKKEKPTDSVKAENGELIGGYQDEKENRKKSPDGAGASGAADRAAGRHGRSGPQ